MSLRLRSQAPPTPTLSRREREKCSQGFESKLFRISIE